MDLLQVLPGLRRKLLVLEADLDKAHDRRHRRAHIVAHVGQEGLFFPARLHRRAERLGHLLDLLGVVDLFRRIHKSDDEPVQVSSVLLRSGLSVPRVRIMRLPLLLLDQFPVG